MASQKVSLFRIAGRGRTGGLSRPSGHLSIRSVSFEICRTDRHRLRTAAPPSLSFVKPHEAATEQIQLARGFCRNTLTLLTAGLPPSRCPSRRCPSSATVSNTVQGQKQNLFFATVTSSGQRLPAVVALRLIVDPALGSAASSPPYARFARYALVARAPRAPKSAFLPCN